MDFRICGDDLIRKLEDIAKSNGVTVHYIITDALNYYAYLADIIAENKLKKLFLIKNFDYDDGILHIAMPCNGPRRAKLRLVDDNGQQQQRKRKREKQTH